MDIETVCRATRREEWKAKIEACRSSGLTVRDWCEQQEISEPTYYYWLKQLRQEHLIECRPSLTLQEINPVFCEVSTLVNSTSEPVIRLQLPGLRLEVDATATYREVRSALSVLKTLC